MSEHESQVALFDTIRLYTPRYPQLDKIFAIPNGGQRHAAVAAKLKKEGVKSGVWDVFVPIPSWSKHPFNDSHSGMFIEMKHNKNKLTKAQKDFRTSMEDDYKFVVCYSAQEAWNAICEYLEIKP